MNIPSRRQRDTLTAPWPAGLRFPVVASCEPSGGSRERGEHFTSETRVDDVVDDAVAAQKLPYLTNRDLSRVFERISIRAAADGRESNGPGAIGRRQLERAAVRGGEQLWLALAPVVPDRPDGVNHPARWQSVALRDLRLARPA